MAIAELPKPPAQIVTHAEVDESFVAVSVTDVPTGNEVPPAAEMLTA